MTMRHFNIDPGNVYARTIKKTVIGITRHWDCNHQGGIQGRCTVTGLRCSVFDSKCNIADNNLGRCEDNAIGVVDYASFRGGGAFKTNQ